MHPLVARVARHDEERSARERDFSHPAVEVHAKQSLALERQAQDRLAGRGFSSSESDEAISSGASGSPVPPAMRTGSSASTSMTSGEAIYNFSKHSASDDAGVSVFRPYQDPAPWMQETVNRFAPADLAKWRAFLVCLAHASSALDSAEVRAGRPRGFRRRAAAR